MYNNKVKDFLYEEESYQIRGACFNVYNNLGGGIKENIIERALIKELEGCNFIVKSQEKIDILYQGEKIDVYIPDLIVNNKIIIELKSKPFITKEDEKQFLGILKRFKI